MNQPIIFIHSAGEQGEHQGSSDLVAYLREALGQDYDLQAPRMPSPESPRYRAWKDEIERVLSSSRGDLLLIGHSLGGSVLLKYLTEERPDRVIAGLFLVATPYWGAEDWEVEEFVLRRGYADGLPEGCSVFIYQSRDDEVVPVAHAERYAREIENSVLRLVDGRGHELEAGLPELITDVRSMSVEP